MKLTINFSLLCLFYHQSSSFIIKPISFLSPINTPIKIITTSVDDHCGGTISLFSSISKSHFKYSTKLNVASVESSSSSTSGPKGASITWLNPDLTTLKTSLSLSPLPDSLTDSENSEVERLTKSILTSASKDYVLAPREDFVPRGGVCIGGKIDERVSATTLPTVSVGNESQERALVLLYKTHMLPPQPPPQSPPLFSPL